ncbi:D-aminoacyl-tRNA deacylase [uncultured Lutibacter sp.]|uniref:D-aminoacyl-tRNA deacylase n=1 Tax=uncultured Lutibacter sp. TaxID=437739 RepID=UPI002633091C|nr:D-aminoacyl-tRNA deacylase [uncultured Lutibacter sp.]
MRAVLQRVIKASVTIEEKIVSEINSGLLILLGIEAEDTIADIEWLSKKIVNLRIFNDENGVMNNSLLDENGDAIIVSQFTLHASTKKGNRPSYIKAAKPEISIPLYQLFIADFEKQLNKKVGTGEFGADMQVSLINDGPVTICIDSKRRE